MFGKMADYLRKSFVNMPFLFRFLIELNILYNSLRNCLPLNDSNFDIIQQVYLWFGFFFVASSVCFCLF